VVVGGLMDGLLVLSWIILRMANDRCCSLWLVVLGQDLSFRVWGAEWGPAMVIW